MSDKPRVDIDELEEKLNDNSFGLNVLFQLMRRAEELKNKNEKLTTRVKKLEAALEKIAKPFDVHYETNYYAIAEYDKNIAEQALKDESEGQ